MVKTPIVFIDSLLDRTLEHKYTLWNYWFNCYEILLCWFSVHCDPEGHRDDVRQDGELFFMIGDHLGSTSIVIDANGTKVSEMRYRVASLWDKAWGEVRYESGATPTGYTYTGQYSYTADFGLMFYREASRSDSEVDNARWYDPSLGRFAQADTVMPNNIQGFDRYAYVLNNPLKYADPSGHIPKEEICKYMSICGKDAEDEFLKKYGQEIFDLLWETDITWGDKLEWKVDGKLQVAMLVLYTTDGENFAGALWMIEGDNPGYPAQFSNLVNADKDNDGHSTVTYSIRYNDIEKASDLPIGFPIPDGPYDGNIPYMQSTDWTTGPEGMLVLTIASFIPSTAMPTWVARGLLTTNLAVNYFGLDENPPYWYTQAFGPIQTYPTVCYASALRRSCNKKP